MKYGIAIIWEGPHELREQNDALLKAMVELVARELVSTNKHFATHGLPQLKFALHTRNEVDHLPQKADC